MISVKITGIEALKQAEDAIATRLAPAMLTKEVEQIAQQCGVTLKAAAVRACIEAIYQHESPAVLIDDGRLPHTHGSANSGLQYERTEALLESHELVSNGLIQVVTINPDMEVENPRENRERVIDYARHVHDGYTQWVPQYNNNESGLGTARNTGVFHPGRFWFDVAQIEAFPVIIEFVMAAYNAIVIEALGAIA